MKKAKVTRPTFDKEDKIVTLTATITKGTSTKVKEFQVKVKKEGITDAQAVIVDLNSVIFPANVKSDLVLPLSGVIGSTISWSSSAPSVVSNTGKVTRPNVGGVDTTVTLTATATKGSASETKTYSVLVKPWVEQEELDDAVVLINWELIKSANASKSSIISNLNLPKTIGRSVAVTWTTSNNNYCTSAGVVTRPAHAAGPIALSVTAKLTHGSLQAQEVTISGLTISTLEMTNLEVVDRTKSVLSESQFLGTNSSLIAIIDSMVLPVKVSDPLCTRATITWSLANLAHTPVSSSLYTSLTVNPDSVTCLITRPTAAQGNQQLSLVATITVGEGAEVRTDKRYFDISILALPVQI